MRVPAFLPDGPASRAEVAALHGAIGNADAAVGRITAAFRDSARADDVVLGFAADHGLAMPGAKCTLYDPGLDARAGRPPGRRALERAVSRRHLAQHAAHGPAPVSRTAAKTQVAAGAAPRPGGPGQRRARRGGGFSASDEAGFITGSTLLVDGGMTVGYLQRDQDSREQDSKDH